MNARQNSFTLCAVILGSAILAYRLYPVGDAVAQASPPPSSRYAQVRVALPGMGTPVKDYRFSVRLAPIEEAMLYARANGYVEEWLVDIGERVSEGQLLARLALPELEEQINQVKAEISSLDAEVLFTGLQSDRVAALVASGHVSRTERDQRAADYQVALARRDAQRARLGQLERELDYTAVRAPFDGVITVRNVNRGDRIAVTDTRPLFRLIDAQRLRLVIEVPQLQLAYIALDEPALLEVAERPGQRFPARFWKKSEEVGPGSGTMRVEFLLDNAQYELPAGLSGHLAVPVSAQDIPWLPINTLRIAGGEAHVLTVTAGSTVQKVPVLAGRYSGSQVEILFGLTAAERVIINPNALLREGDTVEVVE
jgi:RND family efflux transporter MFP subunit